MQHSIEEKIAAAIQTCLSSFSHPADADLLAHLEEALRFRYSGTAPEEIRNIYLKEYEIPQIVLFDILANRFPLVLNAQRAVLQILMDRSTDAEHITILDLGIGRGLQAIRILKALAERKNLKSVQLIGVEIMKDALDFTINQINELIPTLPFTLAFHPIHSSFEQLDWKQVQSAIQAPVDFFMINASLALHHIQHENNRRKIFEEACMLKPDLFTLIEPNADNYTNDFQQRLLNSYEHFSALYAFIRQLDLTDAEKKGLKQFFSHEFYDNIALPDSHRFEKHQRGEKWLEYAAEGGFQPIDHVFEKMEFNIIGIGIDQTSKPYLNFSYPPSDILAIIAVHLK